MFTMLRTHGMRGGRGRPDRHPAQGVPTHPTATSRVARTARTALTALTTLTTLIAAVGCTPAGEPCPRPTCPRARAASGEGPAHRPAARRSAEARPTVAEARAFLEDTERQLLELWIRMERMHWVQSTYLTHDTNLLAATADEAVMAFVGERARAATRFDELELEPPLRRRFRLLKRSLNLPAPRDAKARRELARAMARMKALYGKGRYCRKRGKPRCLSLGQMSERMAKSRKPAELKRIWLGWRTVSPPMRPLFERYVRLGNQGARTLGFKNLADLWRSKYDMAPAAFEKEVDRLYHQVKPLYEQLHCYVRARLRKKYGPKVVPATGPIPAHLLGNMWAQDWGHLYPLLAPDRRQRLDLDRALQRKKLDAHKMVRYAERFFTSLGLSALPKSFWERSMFHKPKDRDVVCHASAWNIDWVDDLRIKMCIKVKAEDFVVIHHELGHNYYQRAYAEQPVLFRDSANDGFHEALGDTIALSVTPSYLKQVGIIRRIPKPSLNPLMRRALDKVAFLPFGLLVDKWRWGVFDGRTPPSRYNAAWWALRKKYQGVAAPAPRGEDLFDPGAKYHIPANVPYMRYFLAAVLQFQFHRALCRVAGHKGPLHTCSIFGNRAAGERLARMMALGMSRPWPEALEALTGERKMDASALLDYFEPLRKWLAKQNKGRRCGW